MKNIEIDEELYQYIARQTKHIGEDASSILRRLLNIDNHTNHNLQTQNMQGTNADYSIITDLLKSEQFITEKAIVSRFILLLGTLYLYNHALFSVATTSLHGSKRQYLARDKESLELSGKNTKPREITGTPYWVITNTNTARKVYILETIMSNMNIPKQLINEVIGAFAPIEHD